MPTVAYVADVLCPMTGPPLAAAGVLVSGDEIVAVDQAAALEARADRTVRVGGVLLPGLVDGHSRVELADAHRLAKPGPHHAWVAAVAGMTASWDHRRWERSAHRGVQQLLRSGVTATADVVHTGPGVPAVSRAGFVGDSFVDVTHVDQAERDEVLAAVAAALELPAAGRRVGIHPGGPHALDATVLQALSDLSARTGAPMLVPVAASQAEVIALWQAEGPLVEQARAAGMRFAWVEEGGTELSPVRYLAQLGVLTERTTLVHGCWVEDNEAALVAEQGVGVVSCPRAEAQLQAGEAPLERYASAGVRMALGTDSAAAVNPPDLLAEAAAWVRLARARGSAFWPSPVGPIPLEEAAIRLATIDGARTLGWGGQAGILEPGRRADLVAVDVKTTAERAYADLIDHGAGRQVLTILGGVRKARRYDADTPWPAIDHELEDPAP